MKNAKMFKTFMFYKLFNIFKKSNLKNIFFTLPNNKEILIL